MFPKKITLILLVFFVLCFSLACVNASQDNISKTFIEKADEITSENDAVINEMEYNDAFKSVENEPILKTSFTLNGGTFEDIQNLVDNAESGDTIVLNGRFIAKDDSSVISINKKLNIISSSGATLDGISKSRLFNIKPDAKGLIIENIIFKNGYSKSNGGAIYLNTTNVVINKCTFDNCFSSRGGGAIFASFGNDNLVINESKFYSNYATSAGGAIVYFSKNLEIYSCIFDKNYMQLSSEGFGGGTLQIGLENEENNCKINDCIFNNNYVTYNSESKGHAGVACLRRGVTFNNCSFMNNTAYNGGVLGFHDGGHVINCRFYNNSAMEFGGAIGFDSNINQTGIVENSYFDNNFAKNGGAIYFVSKGIVLNCSFFNNNAINNGGAIYTTNQMIINQSAFINNNAINNGGAIYTTNQMIINQPVFINNPAMVTLSTSVPKYVNCSNDAIITVNFNSGNNILNAIWSNTQIITNGNPLYPSFSENIVLNINGKSYNGKTNSLGIVTFKFNTKDFPIKTQLGTVSCNVNGKTYLSNFNLVITTM